MVKERLIISPVDGSLGKGRVFLETGEIPTSFRGSRIIFATSLDNTQVVIKIPKESQSAEKEWEGLVKTL